MSSGETSSNRDIFFTEDADLQAEEIRHHFFLIWSNLTIMAHIMGRKLENHHPELKIY